MRPTRRLLILWLLPCLTGALASLRPELRPLWLGTLGLIALAMLPDALLLWLTPSPRLQRLAPHSLPLAVWHEASLILHGSGPSRLRLTLTDNLPEGLEAAGLPVRLELAPGQPVRVSYRMRGLRRGLWQLTGCDLLLHGPLGLLDQRRPVPADHELRVLPHFADVARHALLATNNRLSQPGIHLRRRRGEGLEFHQLREYRLGDSPRQVDWKATSRLRKLVSREYQDERDQQVLLLLDTGFRMRAQDDRLSHFDQALNAALLLAQAVCAQGDAIGLMTFGGNERYLPPRKGHAALRLMMERLYDLQPTPATPDYPRAVQALSARLRKRSLVVILTNLRDEDGHDLLEACRLLGRTHLVLVAALREQLFSDLRAREPAHADEALTLAAAEDYLALRERVLGRLTHAGARVVDCAPGELAVGLVNQYLEIKRGGRL